jgi:hypothetical protein
MFNYKISIKKVSGRLNESVLPNKNLVIKSKVEKTQREVLKDAAKYLLENYGLELRDAELSEVPSKPKRKAPLQKERFTIKDIIELCKTEGNFDGREYNYSGYRTTPDGREYQLKVSSCATSGKRIWIWTGSPSVKWTAKAVALYDGYEGKWKKKRNNFIEIVD